MSLLPNWTNSAGLGAEPLNTDLILCRLLGTQKQGTKNFHCSIITTNGL